MMRARVSSLAPAIAIAVMCAAGCEPAVSTGGGNPGTFIRPPPMTQDSGASAHLDGGGGGSRDAASGADGTAPGLDGSRGDASRGDGPRLDAGPGRDAAAAFDAFGDMDAMIDDLN